MLKTYAAFFTIIRSVVDVFIFGCCWMGVYWVRFNSGIFSAEKGVPGFGKHLILIIPVIVICYLGCLWSGLYKSRRIANMFRQFVDMLKAAVLSGVLILAFMYYVKDVPYSRKLLVLFVVMLMLGLSFSHLLVMSILRYLRRKGFNQRHYAVIGAGAKGQQLVNDIERMEWTGLNCVFFADNDEKLIDTKISGVPVLGPVERLGEIVKDNPVDEIYLTLGGSETSKVYPILEELQLTGVTVRIIPDWGNLLSISKPAVTSIGSQVLFSAADSPLSGYKIIIKHVFDFVGAIILLTLFSVPILVIALLVKLSSKGPVFYKQRRVGMDNKEFDMLKFRTMKVDCEAENGPQWSTRDDPRCTSIGGWLRRTSLDELPQLINIIKGQMSLIGPRPERPYFVKQFSEDYRRYMLRHKVKSGMTGWAQINGFRGDSSLRKRLIYDLYYVRNWSFGMDVWILLRTPWHIIKGKNAH